MDVARKPATFVDVLRWRALHQADGRAFIFLAEGEREQDWITYQELDQQARMIASQLQALGATGERVLLLYPPGLQYISAFLGCFYAGAIAVPTYPPRLNRVDARLQAIRADAQPTVALTTTAIFASLEARFAQTPDLAALHWLDTTTLGLELSQTWRPPPIRDDSLAFLQYTSGSTAAPRGVMVTHANLLHNQQMIQQAFGTGRDTVAVGWLPLYHDMGLIGNVLQSLYLGSPCILMSPLDFLQQPIRWLRAISHYRATTSGAPNFAYDLCVRKITPQQCAGLDLRSWQVAFNGAEPIRPHTLEQFAHVFQPYGFRAEAFYPTYGLAEATLFVSGALPGSAPVLFRAQKTALEQHRASPAIDAEGSVTLVGVGRLGPAQQVVIVDPHAGIECRPGCVGEIWVAGRHVAQGYWGRPQESEATFQAYRADTGEGPYLRTGDLGFLHDRELFITGRLKDLMIVRGRNYYPQDIELTVGHAHPALEPAGGAAFVVERDGEERLVVLHELQRARRDALVEEVAAAIRRAVGREHALQVYAVVLLRPLSIPKTSSGKIQRSLCRARFLAGQLQVIGSSVRDPVRVQSSGCAPEPGTPPALRDLEAQVASLLGVPAGRMEARQPLIELGLDSLLAVELQHWVQARFGAVVPAVDFLEGLSVAGLAERLLEQPVEPERGTPALIAEPPSQEEAAPLSFEQERLWALQRIRPNHSAYVIPFALQIGGPLDAGLLERSLNEIIRRHAALRTRCPQRHGGPALVVDPHLDIALSVRDLSALAEAERVAEARRQIDDAARRPFDLALGPLLRATLLRLDDETHILVLVLHHIVFDLWSMGVLLQELAVLYRSFALGTGSPLPEPAIQYANFARRQRQSLQEDMIAGQLAYWRRLAGLSARPLLPTDHEHPAVSRFRGASHFFTLAPELAEAVREASRGQGATPFMLLLSAFDLLLHRYAGETDIVVGSPVSGRSRPELERLIGFFAYPLPLRADLSGDPPFRELLARVRRAALEAYAHQDIPFAWIARAAASTRNPGRGSVLFQTMFSLVKSPLAGVEIPGLTLQLLEVDSGATDLELFLTLVEEGPALRGILTYDAELFDPETIAGLADFYREILERATVYPQMRLSEFKVPWPLEQRARASRLRKNTRTIAIAATFTADPVKLPLTFWMQRLNLPALVAMAPYSQVFQQLLDPSSLLGRNQAGVNVVLLRFEDWLRDGAGDRQLEQNLRDLSAGLRAAVQRAAPPYVVCVCPASPAACADQVLGPLLRHMEAALVAEFSGVSGVYVVPTTELSRLYPTPAYYDANADRLGHIPYTTAFFTALGTLLARRISMLHRPPYKVIVLDCDHTLWRGVCAEDGPSGVELDPPRKLLQEFMRARQAAGMLLCLCSKNTEADVTAVFERRPEMPLRREHFVSWRANWRPKPENIRSLAEELRLGLESFIFLDDNPVECAEMQAACPEVLTLCLPSQPDRIPHFLAHVWAFDQLHVTEADRQRSAFYTQNAAREDFQKIVTLEEFLAGLELQVEISELGPAHLARVAQLTQRTNQFNTTTIRRSEGELRQLCLQGKQEGLVIEVRDRFGDYGLVGALIFERHEQALAVDSLLLSCRALGKGVEQRVLAYLGALACTGGLQRVIIPYLPTQRNQPAGDFLAKLGAQFRHSDGERELFTFPATFLAALGQQPAAQRP